MVKTGSMNMAKAIRRIGHRSGQARKMTFYRDPLEAKDDYGVETDVIATGNEGLTIPNIDAFIAPIVTSSDNFTRAGHTVVGAATIYIPALSTIKNNILGVTDDWGARFWLDAIQHNARLSSFNELEGKDILYDMEKVINYQAVGNISSDRPGSYSAFSSRTPCFEGDRIQFKIKNNSGTDIMTRIIMVQANGSPDGQLTWSFAITAGEFIIGHEYKIASTGTTDFTAIGSANSNVDTVFTCATSSGTGTGTAYDTSYISFDDAKYHIVDLPVSGVSTGDKAYYIYVPSSGASSPISGIRTLTATVENDFDIKDADGENSWINYARVYADAGNDTFVSKDFYLYKAGEWRIENIKEYRDEYMELGCTKIRGERGSRRRAY